MTNLVHSHKIKAFLSRVVSDGRYPRLDLFDSAYFRTYLHMNHSVGDSVTVTITNRKPTRTGAQNRYYWGAYLPMISKETGEDNLDHLHELFKGKFLTETIAEVLGEKVRIKKSSTDLSVMEFSEYIRNIEVLTGVLAPPAEFYGLAPLR